MKTCVRCETSKSLDCFYGRVGSKDGLRGTCIECDKANAAKWQSANPVKTTAAKRKHHEQNIDRKKAAIKAFVRDNRDIHRAAVKRWKAENKGKSVSYHGKRRAAKLQATPAWANKKLIEEFYFAADFLGMITGEWHHVDHTVPLQSDLVCGLHWEGNLQVLTAKENLLKLNVYWPDMP